MLLAVFTYGLFEFVRRNVQLDHSDRDAEWQPPTNYVHANLSRFEKLERDIATLAEEIKQTPKPDDLLSLHQEASEMAKKVRASVGSDLNKITDAIREMKLDIENQKWATLAIYHRERMLDLAKQIDTLGDEVAMRDDLSRHLDEADFERWESKFFQWRETLGEWCHYASFYVGHNPQNDIEQIDESGLNQNWSVKAEQFPDGGIIKYKTFRIYLRNWVHARDVVHGKVRMQAFEGQPTNTREHFGS